MPQHEELTHFAGFDWAKDHHDIIIIDSKGHITADFRIEHTAAGWSRPQGDSQPVFLCIKAGNLWGDKIAAYPKLSVAMEPTTGRPRA